MGARDGEYPDTPLFLSSNFFKKGKFYRLFSLLAHIVYEYSLLNNSISSKETIMYNSEKISRIEFFFLRLRMNLSYNETNIRKILHFWVEICTKPPDIAVILCVQNGF